MVVGDDEEVDIVELYVRIAIAVLGNDRLTSLSYNWIWGNQFEIKEAFWLLVSEGNLEFSPKRGLRKTENYLRTNTP